MIGIAWQVREGESLEDAIRRATVCHEEKFGCRPDYILVDPAMAENFIVEGLTVIGNAFVGKSYTFLLYRRQRFDKFLLHQKLYQRQRFEGEK